MAATAGSFWVADCSQQFTDRYDNPEYRIPETMFIWGNYPLRANSDGFYGHWVVDLMKRGMEVVMIDPKVTWLSAHSRLHLRVRPGCAHPRDLPPRPRATQALPAHLAPRARSLPPFAPRTPRQHPRAARSLFQLVMRNVSARSLLAVK